MLAKNINIDELAKLFKDLEINVPDFMNRKYLITVSEYSKFLELLYNATYLDKKNSEYALSLLDESKGKKKGIMKFLPDGSKTIHKFSNRFNNNQYELRESGIIYTKNDAFQLTIFATGNNNTTLDSATGNIGKIVYDWIKNM